MRKFSDAGTPMDRNTRCLCCTIIVCATAVTACRTTTHDSGRDTATHKREVVITMVPLLTKELAKTYPFLTSDFSKGGVLDGKEIYEFMPSTITVMERDTLNLTFINPEDDPHSFVLEDLSVAIPAQAVTHATYVARRAGIFDFVCDIPAHLPMMRGQLVVLRPERVTP